MGCWNKTCGLTNLPIMSGEQTYVFVIERVKTLYDHCYATHLYRPLLLPFVSDYDDYGGGENSGGPAFQTVMDAIKSVLIEMPVGKNPYHDIAVTRKDWGEKPFFESARENRLRYKRWDGETEIDFVMLRKDAVDDLMDTYEFEEYVGIGKGTLGYDNSYRQYRFADLVADMDPLIDHIERIMKEQRDILPWFHPETVIHNYINGPGDLNRTAKWLRHDEISRFSCILRVRQHIFELLANDQRPLAKALMIEHLKGMFVDRFIEMTRKSWIPGGQEGSQSSDYQPYRALISAMNRCMDAQDARYAADYGDDEDV